VNSDSQTARQVLSFQVVLTVRKKHGEPRIRQNAKSLKQQIPQVPNQQVLGLVYSQISIHIIIGIVISASLPRRMYSMHK